MDSILYIATDVGVITARSHDQRTWEIAERGLANWSVSAVAVSPDSPNKVFAGTRGDGVCVSEDFGKTWKKPCYGKRGPGKVKGITIDPHDSRRIYAGCEPIDIFVSEDEGKNWERFDSIWDDPFIATIPYPVPTVEPHVRSITIDPKNQDIIYAALQVGYIGKSTDRGKNWKILNKGLDCDVHTITIDPTNSKRVLVTTGGHDARLGRAPGRALYVSEDAGESWFPMAMNFNEEYAIPLALDPRDPNRIYSALANGQPGQWRRRDSGAEAMIIRSKDGGQKWEKIDRAIEAAYFPEAIVVDETMPDRVYAACRNGDFYSTEDGGDSWGKLGLDLKIGDLSNFILTHA